MMLDIQVLASDRHKNAANLNWLIVFPACLCAVYQLASSLKTTSPRVDLSLHLDTLSWFEPTSINRLLYSVMYNMERYCTSLYCIENPYWTRRRSWNDQYYKNNFMLYCNLPTACTKKFRKKYLRQPSIDFDFCNVSSSCDVACRGHWLTQAGYWFILRFCEHFTCLSS